MIYGNLILNINIGRFEIDIVNEWYELYELHKDTLLNTVNESGGTALFTDGYCDIYTYDDRNNLLSEESFLYWGLPHFKNLRTYMYVYSNNGRILEETEFRVFENTINTIIILDNIILVHTI